MSDDESRDLLRKAREGDPNALVQLENVAFRAHGRRVRPRLNVVQATAPFGQVALCVHPARDVYATYRQHSEHKNEHPNVVIHLANFVMQKCEDHSLVREEVQKRECLGAWDVRPESLRSSPISVLVNYQVDAHIDGAMKLAFVEAHNEFDDEDDYDENEEAREILRTWANRHVPLFLRRWLPQNEDFLRQGRRYAAQIVTKHLMTRFRALQKQYETSRNETIAALQLALELGDDPLTTPRSPKPARMKAPAK